ncbi:L,D-transpeptidase [Albirhodobacter sp. R86504]|uniref:L,D-transpeptidase n=1 Tax=Albirhodobacter sp. R86504 TaxID=3093848 RepID=UPI00366CAD66
MTASRTLLDRRRFLGTAAATVGATLAAPALAQSQAVYDPTAENHETTEYTNDRRNISSFRTLDWRPYFDNTANGAVLVDTISRALHFWSEDQTVYKLYPTSVPLTADLTRRGRTEIIKKVEGPTWSPTPSMKERNPEWPDFVPAGPDNPLGTHALWLSWQYYRIHGTHDTRKIGRKSSNGCIGLYNEQIAELFSLTKVGTQVLLI